MSKLVRGFLVCILVATAGICTFACGAKTEKKIVGITDKRIGVSATECDFLDGVTGYDGEKSVEVAADYSAVVFGTAGEYTVKYSVGDYIAYGKVYIYGTPGITFSSNELTYEQATEKDGLLTGVTATDTFGGTLEVVAGEIETDKLGRVKPTQNVEYTATDDYGNVARVMRTFTVKNEYALSDIQTDLADGEAVFALNADFKGIYIGENAVKASAYFVNNGYFGFEGKYLGELGAGEYTYTVVTDKGYSDFKLTVTDNKTVNFEIPDFDEYYLYSENLSVSLPLAEKKGYQNVTFGYAVRNSRNEEFALTDGANGKLFNPTDEGVYEYVVSAYRQNQKAGEKTARIVVRKDVAVMTESQKLFGVSGVSEGFASCTADYVTDKYYGDETGSAKITATGEQNKYMAVSFVSPLISSVSGYKAIEFNVLNESSTDMEVFVHWSEIISVPSSPEWTKVTLTAAITDKNLKDIELQFRSVGESEVVFGKSIYISNVKLVKDFGEVSDSDISGNYSTSGGSMVLSSDKTASFTMSTSTFTGTYSHYTNGVFYAVMKASDNTICTAYGSYDAANGTLTFKDSFSGASLTYEKTVDDVSAVKGVYREVTNKFFVINLKSDKTFVWAYRSYSYDGTYSLTASGKVSLTFAADCAWNPKQSVFVKSLNGETVILTGDLGAGSQTYELLTVAESDGTQLTDYAGTYNYTDNGGTTFTITVDESGNAALSFNGNDYPFTCQKYGNYVLVSSDITKTVFVLGTDTDGNKTISGDMGLDRGVSTFTEYKAPQPSETSLVKGIYKCNTFWFILNSEGTYYWGYPNPENGYNAGTYAYADGTVTFTKTEGAWFKTQAEFTFNSEQGAALTGDYGAGAQTYTRVSDDVTVKNLSSEAVGKYTDASSDSIYIEIKADGSMVYSWNEWNSSSCTYTLFGDGYMLVRCSYATNYAFLLKYENSDGVYTLTGDTGMAGSSFTKTV